MSDPEGVLIAEVAGQPPVPVDAPLAPPTDPGTAPPASTSPAPVVQQPVAAPAPPTFGTKLWGFVRARWRLLVTPTAKKPRDYDSSKLAMITNEELDGGAGGPAHKNQVGQSVALVVDHLLTKGDGAQTPLGHLTESSLGYGWTLWDTARHGPPPTPAPTGLQDQRQAAPPAAAPPRVLAPARGDSAVEPDPGKAARRKPATKARGTRS